MIQSLFILELTVRVYSTTRARRAADMLTRPSSPGRGYYREALGQPGGPLGARTRCAAHTAEAGCWAARALRAPAPRPAWPPTHPPRAFQVCEHFLAEVEKGGGRQEARAPASHPPAPPLTSLRASQIPSILTTPTHYIFHIERGDLALLCTTSVELPPLLATEFLVRVADIFADYFEGISSAAIKQHFVTVYQLLEEMCDSGMPTSTEGNVLRELIPPPSLVGRLSSVMAGSAGVAAGAVLPGGVASAVPWRRSDAKYASNEIFFDVVETVDATFDSESRLLFGAVYGEVYANTRLSGMPDLTLSFANHGLLDDVRFHPCVRFSRFAADRVLSFVPPDGVCKLMSYKVRDPPGGGGGLSAPPIPVPMYVKPQFSFSESTGRISVMVGPRVDLGKPLEAISVRVPLPRCVASIDVSANHGTVGYDEKAKVISWDVGRIPKDRAPILSGILQLDRARERGEGEGGPGTPRETGAGSVVWDEALCIEASFKVAGASVSGLAVDSLHLVNEQYKLYKGVRYSTTAGRFVVRM